MLQNKIIIFISFFLWAFLLPAAGKLEVKEGKIQFGSFDANTPLAASYQIRNAGNSVIRIVGSVPHAVVQKRNIRNQFRQEQME